VRGARVQCEWIHAHETSINWKTWTEDELPAVRGNSTSPLCTTAWESATTP
jgi:hypothetical protein